MNDANAVNLPIGGAQFSITETTPIEYVSVTDSSEGYGAVVVSNGETREFAFADKNGNGISAPNGANVIVLTYKVPEDCEPGTYPVEFSNNDFFNISSGDGLDMTEQIERVNGAIIVKSPITTTSTSTPTTTTTEAAIITTEPTTTTTEDITTIPEPTITTEATTTSTTATENHIASDEELCNWSINDYNDKNEGNAVSAEITEKSNNQYEITLIDDSDNVLDVYEIDPETGIGTDSNGNEVNLPQTGNNSLTNIMTVLGACVMTVFGFVSVRFSRIFRRKENE